MTIKDTKEKLNLWKVYIVCLLISTIFFLLFGFNSPVYIFNTDPDYHWFMTIGNGLANGKIPYRDLFDQKGPILYFIYAFCCLFPNPRIVILIIEILSMSLFFFFAYRISNQYLNTFYSFLAIPLLAFAVFTTHCRLCNASTVEEFCLPIYAYFLFCWIEFLTKKQPWSWIRSLCLGICFGLILWTKYTLAFFMIIPMVIWAIINLRQQLFHTLIKNILYMLAGVLITTIPILIFYATHHALDDLFYVYFIINLTSYAKTDFNTLSISFDMFFTIGPIFLFFMLWGITRFSIKYWKQNIGWLLLTSFLATLLILIYSCKCIRYYFGQLFPYTIFGIIDILALISKKLTFKNCRNWIQIALIIVINFLFLLISIPCSPLTKEWTRSKDDYAPLVIANEINKYEKEHQTDTSIYLYKVLNFGFYNTTNKIPDDYFCAQNIFDQNRFPEMYESYTNTIISNKRDFVITGRGTWENEKDFLSQYYTPYHNNDADASTYRHRKIHFYIYTDVDLILLIKK